MPVTVLVWSFFPFLLRDQCLVFLPFLGLCIFELPSLDVQEGADSTDFSRMQVLPG